jgi:SAM-dependent methyltransferase
MTLHDDWDTRYRDGNTPWDTNHPSTQLRRVVESGEVTPCRTLELGCGTGTNAVYLARLGFDVTAVDISGRAIEMTRRKAAAAGVACRLITADVLDLPDLGAPFEFIFDRGCFHVVRRNDETGVVRAIASRLGSSGRLLVMTGNADEPSDPGPPVLTEQELRDAFADELRMEWLRACRFDKVAGDDTEPLAWIAMMRKA